MLLSFLRYLIDKKKKKKKKNQTSLLGFAAKKENKNARTVARL